MRLPKYIAACSLAALGFSATASMADVVVVVSAKSQVVALSKSQVADIFLGKSARFPDGSSAVPIDQVEGTAVRDEFYNSIAGKSAAQIKAHWSKIIFTGRGQPPKAVSNSAAARELVATNPQAISYIERSAVDGSVKVLFPP
jgi:ABC-type phosphate transport system substrate-binding protein